MNLKYLILIFLLTVLFTISVRNDYELFIINEKKWLNYRLGDTIKGMYNLRQQSGKYPGSIAEEYVKLTSELEKKNNNFEVLHKIIKNRSKNNKIPDKNDIVIHIRLGDSITKFDNGKIKYLRNNWATNINKLDNILETFRKNKSTSKIYLVYGAHKKNINLKANHKFLEKIENIFKKYNFKYEKKNDNPDDDFLFMCNSKTFIKSGGGFSRIISQIVKSNGGKIYDPKI